ncbi:polycomb protein Asx-like [Microplitis mediator]|uniref:polycomb protein Asx-like n=1 Tax=Microplitis mediator TaxID=375433 RepID=UPI002554F4D1|nr:polycomb protein Asx-like [Microplitis mediator]XP_057337308.1 polycomb protein Asx-like [Microplitis mediator]XP_057337309.1 polycomb protein Asx-like [Microplitis mediator]
MHTMDIEVETSKADGIGEINPGCSGYSGMVHSKKVIKHALRQQAKRRRKNTTIASGNSRTLPRIVVKPLAPPPAPSPPPPSNDPPPPTPNMQHSTIVEEPAATMREVLASLPGFSLKSSRRRSTKRLSAAAQLEAGLVDLESPASILASTSLRALLNRHTFQGLPPLYQRKLAQLLPAVDRQDAATSGLNNEFFARACLEWRKRLAEGEFTPENQQRLKMEAEKDKNKLDPWKLKHFEPIWGEKREPKFRLGLHCMNEPRTGGAVTRSSLRLRLESTHEQYTPELYQRPVITTDKIEETDVPTRINPPVPETPSIISDTSHDPLIKDITTSEVENRLEQPASNNIVETVITNGIIEKESNEEEECHKEELEKAESPVETETPMEINQTNISEVLEVEIQPEEESKEPEVITSPSTEEKIHLEEQIIEVLAPVVEEITTVVTSVTPTMIVTTSDLEHSQEFTVSEQIECQSQDECDTITELTMSLSEVSEIQVLHDTDDNFDAQFDSSRTDSDKMFEISECENAAAVESISAHDSVKSDSVILEEHDVINVQINADAISATSADSEPIPDAMEIDSETLQRIHELEVRGEMREAYEEISGCTEEIIYPILEGMEMGSSGSEETDTQEVTETTEDIREQSDIVEINEDEELRDANNYVCSEMLECSWPVDATVTNNNSTIDDNSSQEDLQVPWPLVAAALDGSVAANITVTTQDECNDTSTTTDSTTSNQQAQVQQQQQSPFVNETSTESVNCISLPVVQSTPFQSDGITISTPATSCLLKNVQTSQSPPIITFPTLQPIRFVPTRLHTSHTTTPTTALTSTLPTRISTQQHNQTTHQVNVARSTEEIVQLAQSNMTRVNTPNNISIRSNSLQPHQHVQATVGVTTAGHPQSAIVVQHQTPIPVTQSRPIVANMQPQQFVNTNVTARSARSSGPGSYRGSRNGNKEQSSGRSRTSTKEPPGAVNLERSYQICQAVIQSSPNRDQLKAHLKPPPSLLARGDGAFTTSKSGGRTITTVKTQKPHQTSHQHQKNNQNKTQAVMLRQVFATARQPSAVEVTENSNTSVAQLGTNGAGNFGQYILVQRTGVSDGAPRASSAPPLPPQIAGIGVGVHLVRGRPASAGEGSHQAVTLKARGTSDGRGSGGAEPGAPGVIMGGDPPPPCECSIRGAMVICRQCGAFCHDDCIGPQRICATCLIR